MRYDETSKILALEGDDSPSEYLTVNGVVRLLQPLYDGAGSGKGKNSSVFAVIDPEGLEEDYVVKFCNDHDKLTSTAPRRKRFRFEAEIAALIKARDALRGDYVLNIIDHGTHKIGDRSFLYYVMENAECDLSHFLFKNELSPPQRIVLCYEIRNALKALHSLGIYHRDLKPDNVFFVKERWKVGDLGYIARRDEDFEIDGRDERIGPTGRMSPEAVNKAFAITDYCGYNHDTIIDEKSEIFQLGKLFWFILQGNLPTGQVKFEDFFFGDERIFNIIFPMLQYAKSRRPSMADLDGVFEGIKKEYAI
jgi:serine/threonine protein kinase